MVNIFCFSHIINKLRLTLDCCICLHSIFFFSFFSISFPCDDKQNWERERERERKLEKNLWKFVRIFSIIENSFILISFQLISQENSTLSLTAIEIVHNRRWWTMRNEKKWSMKYKILKSFSTKILFQLFFSRNVPLFGQRFFLLLSLEICASLTVYYMYYLNLNPNQYWLRHRVKKKKTVNLWKFIDIITKEIKLKV